MGVRAKTETALEDRDLSEDDRLSQDSDWTDDIDLSCQPVLDFFGSFFHKSLAECLQHYQDTFDLDIMALFATNTSSLYEVIQLVNFIRDFGRKKQVEAATGEAPEILVTVEDIQELLQLIAATAFKEETFLVPVAEDDILLQILPERLFPDSDMEDMSQSMSETLQPTKDLTGSEEANIMQARSDLSCEKSSFLQQLETRIEQGQESSTESNSDGYYFDSYGFMDIHREMLSDTARNDAYEKALQECCKDQVVMDVGCGTAILSLFAIKYGAKRVVAIDNSDVVYTALQILQRNHEQHPALRILDKILLLKGRAEDLASGKRIKVLHSPQNHGRGVLPRDFEADIIVSEWMGYGLFFESMLDSVFVMRDRYLRTGGMMIPGSCSLFVQAHSSSRFSTFKSLGGFDFAPVAFSDDKTAQVDEVERAEIISTKAPVITFDLSTCTAGELDFTSEEFKLVILEAEHSQGKPLTSVVLSFDCSMLLGTEIVLSTSAEATQTHWRQCVLYLNELVREHNGGLVLKPGEVIYGRVRYNKRRSNKRSIDITIELRFPERISTNMFKQVYKLS